MSAQEITDIRLLALIEEQRRDDELGHRRMVNAPLEILAGLNPYGLAATKPRVFLSGRKVVRRPQRRKGAVVKCGTEAMYKRGCRCDECRVAHSVRNKAQRSGAVVRDGDKT